MNIKPLRIESTENVKLCISEIYRRISFFHVTFKERNPSLAAKQITVFLLQSENPPCDITKSILRLKVWSILKRYQVKDLLKPGAPCILQQSVNT